MITNALVVPDLQDEKVYNEIKNFLTPKKSNLLNTLHINGELSQGELAEKANTTVTALSNMLVKFDQFKYSLLTITYKGRYRYYYLTELALSYLEKAYREEQENRHETLILHEGARLAQEAQKYLLEFQKTCAEDWDVILDDLLRGYIRIEPVKKPEEEKLLNRFIHCLERLTAEEYYNYFEKTLALLKDTILQKRLEQFSQLYETTFVVVKALENAEKTYTIYQVLHMLISDGEVSNDMLEPLQWKKNYVKKLRDIIQSIVSRVGGWTQYDIYICLKRYFQEQEQLCAFLAHDIYNVRIEDFCMNE